jgi:hypothetical protein
MSVRSSIGLAGRAAAADEVHYRQFDDELVLLDLSGGHYFALNSVGARMWHSLVAGKSPAEVAVELAGEYDVALEQLTRDCVALADELVERGLLKRASS